ncbi:unnamed protein product [Sphagnum jensenii]|uniref:Uncharacterized protein n=1 Tax=Sphagnum jensenii TaxID=128206 RepID=A0ABP0VEJ2_9BRYO
MYRYSTSDAAKNALVLGSAAKSRVRRRLVYDSTPTDKKIIASLALGGDPDIITFEDFVTGSSLSSGSSVNNNSNVSKLDFVLTEWREAVISIEKDNTHFEVLPRIPVAPSVLTNHINYKHHQQNQMSSTSAVANDGSSFIVSAGDFLGHQHRVVSLNSDFIHGSNTDVIASCDCYGQVLVWTVMLAHSQLATRKYIISRRPQRKFTCLSCVHTCIDISWQMGVVVVGSQHFIQIFSIEREELLRSIDIFPILKTFSIQNNNQAGINLEQKEVCILNECSHTYCTCKVNGQVEYKSLRKLKPSRYSKVTDINTTIADDKDMDVWTSGYNIDSTKVTATQLGHGVIVHRIALCNDGIIVLHVSKIHMATTKLARLRSTTI